VPSVRRIPLAAAPCVAVNECEVHVQVRSPQPSPSSRSAFLRGFAGAGLCVIGIAAVAVPVAGIWPGGDDHATTAPRIANMPDDSGLALIQPAVPATAAHKKKHKAARHTWAVQATGTQIVVRPGASVPASESTPVAPDNAVVAKRPAAKKTPKRVAGQEVVTSGGPPETAAPAATPAPAPAASVASGLVRLSVQSAGIAASASGGPELQVKLGISGAAPTDALPGSVTLHLRPQVPSALSRNDDPTLALKANVDMIDATRTTPNDPALRMRVRMTIANAPVGTPMVQEPAGGDGKSNVIALTVALANFDTGGGTPGDPAPNPGGSGDPTSGPGGPVTPGDPAPTPAPGDPTSGPGGPVTPGDPAPAPAPGDPGTTPAPTDPAPTPAPGDPGTTPAPTPAPGDPGTTPAPTDPAPTPAPGDPAAAPAPPTEIIIPVGPVRPVGGTTTVPVPPTAGDAPVPDVIPIDVTVEQLPPADPPPPSAADVPVAATEVPAAEVPPPPATDPNPDPGTAPDATAPAATDAAAAADSTPVSYAASASG
jgi:hypothetical protein